MKEPSSKTFRYGFLTSRTARLLYEHSIGQQLDEEEQQLVARAEQFVEQILNGEEFVSGEKENIAPGSDALNVLGYGRAALKVMPEPKNGDFKHALTDIRKTLAAIRSHNKNEYPTPEQIEQAAKFFDRIADAFFDEAVASSHPISAGRT